MAGAKVKIDESVDVVVAGELGSIWGFLYLAGGNLAECFISGGIAGVNAAAEAALTP